MNKKVVTSYVVIFVVGLFFLISAACSGISKITVSKAFSYNDQISHLDASTKLDVRSFYAFKEAQLKYQILDENGKVLKERMGATDSTYVIFNGRYDTNDFPERPTDVRVIVVKAEFKNGWVYAVSSIMLAGSLLFFLKDYLAYRKERKKALAESDLPNNA